MSEQPDQSPSVDVNALLDAADPEFTKSLDDVRAVENAADVVIEASEFDHDLGDAPEDGAEGATDAAEAGAVERTGLVWWLTQPKEILGYLFAQLGSLARGFGHLSGGRKLGVLVVLALMALTPYLIYRNLRGAWLPGLFTPPLTRLSAFATEVERFEPKDEISLTAEFPPDLNVFLFKPFKVNLKATPENPWPMGAFELVATFDLREGAIETHEREVEFEDLLQRVFEEETFADLSTEIGKTRLKAKVQRALNEKLRVGRVTDVLFKTFVLKP